MRTLLHPTYDQVLELRERPVRIPSVDARGVTTMEPVVITKIDGDGMLWAITKDTPDDPGERIYHWTEADRIEVDE